ncbi:MAG: G5 domain-containing protein [Bacilli bacterium]
MILYLKMMIPVVLLTLGIPTGTFFFEEIDLVVNNEVIYTSSKYEMNKVLDQELQEYQNDLLDNSREKVIKIESEYTEELNLSEVESVDIVQLSEYEYQINVTHEVVREVSKVIEYTKETKQDSSQYTDYKQVTTKGVNGSENTSMLNIYVNGEWNDTTDINTTIVDAVTEVTTVGTKEIPAPSNEGSYNGGYNNGSSGSTWSGGESNGGSSNGGSSGGYAGGGNSGGSSGGCPAPYYNLNDGMGCGMWVIDYTNCQTDAVSSNCPMIWKPY